MFKYIAVVICSLALSHSALAISTKNPTDANGASCGTVSAERNDDDYISFKAQNRCDFQIRIQGKIGRYPIGNTIPPGSSTEVGCIVSSGMCENGQLTYDFYGNVSSQSPAGAAGHSAYSPTGTSSRPAGVGNAQTPAEGYSKSGSQLNGQPASAQRSGRSAVGEGGAFRGVLGYTCPPQPEYPATSVRLAEEGAPIITIKISEDGRAGAVSIEQSSGFPRLDQSAANWGRQCYFKLGPIGSSNLPPTKQLRVVFELRRPAETSQPYDESAGQIDDQPSQPPPQSSWQKTNEDFQRNAAALYERKAAERRAAEARAAAGKSGTSRKDEGCGFAPGSKSAC